MSDHLAYSPADAAKSIGISKARLYELIGAGQIEARKAGGRTLILAGSLQSYLDSLPKADIRVGQRKAAEKAAA